MKKNIDRFTLIEPIAAGGSGTVFKAEEALPGGIRRTVALKVMPPFGPRERAAEQRFYQEIQSVVRLSGHPHVATVLAMGTTDGTPWIALEYIPTTLTSLITDTPGPINEVIALLKQVGSVLGKMGESNPPLIHNDLKPANILRDDYGRYRLTDFALASLGAMERTHVLATVRYAAPEVMSREFGVITASTDLYALGHIAYEFALGGRLYRQQFAGVFDEKTQGKDAPPARWMAWHCSLTTAAPALIDVRREVPRWLSDVVAKLMAKNAEQRYPRALDFIADLEKREAAIAPTLAPSLAAPIAPATPASPTPVNRTAPTSGEIPLAPASPFPLPDSAGTRSVAAAPGARYYVRFRTQTTGPYDLETLARRHKQGLISRLHQVSMDQQSWTSYDTLLQSGAT